MPTTTLADGTTTITVVSTAPLFINSSEFQAFLNAFYNLHSVMPLASLSVTAGSPVVVNEWDYILTTKAPVRVLDQRLRYNPMGPAASRWTIRPDNSGFFLLNELLLNNTLRSTTEPLLSTTVLSITAVVL